MRKLTFLLLALALAVPVAQAQPPSFDEPYQVRAAAGDIPTTPAAEAAGFLNVEQRLVVDFDNASSEAERTYAFTLPRGATLANATCDCLRSTHSVVGTALTLRIEPQTASGERTIRVVTRQPLADVMGFALDAPAGQAGVVIVYAPNGLAASSDLGLTRVGASTDGSATIFYARFAAGAADGHYVALHPATTAPAAPDGGDSGNGLTWLLYAGIGLLVGIVLWAFLVSKGLVQAKSRKQVVQTAAHVEAAANDPPAVLEGKKRALLAALKEVELAKQANEMPVEVYDAVKADLKKQAVTVMRALEAGADQPKA